MLSNQKTTNTRNNSLMSNFTTELIKNLSNNMSVEEIFRIELEKAFNQLLETELDCFLGYEKYSKDGYNTGDSRNGYYKRSFQTKYGELKLSIPRDRAGMFKQQTLPSHARSDDTLEQMVVLMYSKGVTTREIAELIEKMYGHYYSRQTISNITIKTVNISKVMKDVKPRKYKELRTLFNGIFTYAIASGIITHNPIALIRFKKAERQNRDSLNKEKIDLFFRRIQLPEFEPIRQGAYLLYFFGLRPCEVDEETRREGSFLIARNRKRKNGKIEYKKIPIPKQAEDFINWDEPLIFNCTSSWKQNQLFKAIFNDDETTAYNFRHTFSTICQENGVSRDIVEIWIGDSPQRLIGKVYTHFSDEFMQEQMYKVKFPTFKQE